MQTPSTDGLITSSAEERRWTIVPIYKKPKRLSPTLPKAFRPVALAETILKLTETVFLARVRDIIESKLGDFQHA